MTNTDTITPDRLAAVEFELARLRQAQDRTEADRKTLGLPPAPELKGWKRELADLEERARAIRSEAQRAAGEAHDEQLARTAPERAKLEKTLGEVAAALAEEDARHGKVVEKLGQDRVAAHQKLSALEAPETTYEQLIAERESELFELQVRKHNVALPAGMPPQRPVGFLQDATGAPRVRWGR